MTETTLISADSFAAVRAQTADMVDVSSYVGDGETVPKDLLIGLEFVVTGWKEVPSDRFTKVDADTGIVTPGTFIVVKVLTVDERRLAFTDGGSGIRPVLEQHERAHPGKALYCPRGLRVSEYDYRRDDGSTVAAKTYYFA